MRRLPAHDGVGRLGKVADQINQTLKITMGKKLGEGSGVSSVEYRISRDFPEVASTSGLEDTDCKTATLDSSDVVLEARPSIISSPTVPVVDSTPADPTEPSGPPTPPPGTVTDGHLGLGDGTLPTPSPDPVAGPIVNPVVIPIPGPTVGGGVLSSPGLATTPTTSVAVGTPANGYLDVLTTTPNAAADPTPAPILVVADGQTSTLTPGPTPASTNGPSRPVVAIVDGVASTLSAGQAAPDTNGGFLTVLTKSTVSSSL